MAWLAARDQRISIHYGRLEERWERNQLAKDLKSYLGSLHVRIDPSVYKHLVGLARQHETTTFMVEKAVDVMLAVDLVRMAERNEYDVAYILSADGDYTPGAQLAKAVYKFIPLDRAWFTDCFGE